ncbi:hypothetical protein [Ureibacillus manganicus]|uniref:Uncharacterized protein n=1 Tax=Ureibacillus manganicus DSM 26584 TaxID=1384049 RepID=A0A0A3HTM1_9BACL|nr:hypothetical protein [Ureibacillus manganicus]KGR73638.1 hypothetical protein CD29_19265 [Ureibacillus manganicus DSM 26584]
MRKWIILIIILILGGIIYSNWLSNKESEALKYILNTSLDIDSITVKDGKTKEELLSFSNSDPAFSELANFYSRYYVLEGENKNILTGEPIAEIEYYVEKELKYTVSIYQLKERLIVKPPVTSLDVYQYAPVEKNSPFVFSIKEYNMLFGVNEGMKELMYLLSSRINLEQNNIVYNLLRKSNYF